ncbi:unnamed protein product [Microthlaspi erraticum]|uniref:Uncharacterized protein n=1 Tax=Microthlaspi erraticum TaxID=1685480 RepID=A0A6D2L0C8_9BRAS|nr:unnamed protein product [Microthlaspi erraticum]
MALPPYDPNFTIAFGREGFETEDDQEHDASESATVVAAELISSTRLALKLDSERTEYSSRYLLDNAASRSNLTVKKCLEFAIKNGIPKAEDWPLLGSMVKKPPPSYKPDLVFTKGDVFETKDLDQVRELMKYHPVGAKLHVFSPHIELQQDAIYCASSGEPARYVGLRDGVIVGVEKFKGKSMAKVKLWYKKKFVFVKVALSRMFFDESRGIGPTLLLVDFCVPLLSIN